MPLSTRTRTSALSSPSVSFRKMRSGAWAGLVGLHGDEGWRVAVVHREIPAPRHRPDALVTVGGHHVEDVHLALHHLAVGLPIDELQVGAAAVDRVAVDRAVAVEPDEV